MRSLRLTAVAALAAVPLLAVAAPADAKLIYRCVQGNLCQSNDDGSAQKQITTDGKQDAAARINTSFFGPDLSADGTKVSFFRQDEQRGAYVIDLTTNTRTTIGTGTPDDVQMRPDGKRIAVDEFGGSESAPSVLCYYDTTGGGQLCEPPGGTFGIDYRPDGRLVSLEPSGTGRYYKLCLRFAEGSGKKGCEQDLVVDNTRYLEDAAVSPDGKLLAVTVKTDADRSLGSIGIYDLTTGAFVRSVSNGAQDNDPTWTSDGQRVVFTRGRNTDAPALWSVSVNGPAGSEEKIVDGGLEPTGGPGSVGGAAASAVKVKSAQKGSAVKASLKVRSDDSTVTAKLLSGSKTFGSLKKKGVDAGSLSLKVKLNSKGKKALAAKGKLKLKLVLTVTPPSGSEKTVKKSVTLKK